MAELTSQDMAAKLLADRLRAQRPSRPALSDPIADTPMVGDAGPVAALRPRPARDAQPAYEEIKASIRERGLDAPPAITRRPGEDALHHPQRRQHAAGDPARTVERDQGRTLLPHIVPVPALAGARRNRRADRAPCRERAARRPDVHRARLGRRESARVLRAGKSAPGAEQSELARRLAADGYPCSSHTSAAWPMRCATCCRRFRPCSTAAWAGHQVERLSVCARPASAPGSAPSASRTLTVDFDSFFQDVLAQFDTQGDEFSPQRVQDELIGQMAELLEADYDTLALEMTKRKPPACADQRPDATCATTQQRLSPPPMAPPPSPRSRTSAIATHSPRLLARTAAPAGKIGHPAPARSPPEDRPRAPEATQSRPQRARRALARAHRDAGTDDRAPAVHPAHGRRPAGRCAARLRGRCAAVRSRCRPAGSIPSRTSGTSSPAWTCRIACACTSRSSRARSPRKRRSGRPHRGQRRRHRLRLRGAGRGPGEGAAGVRAGGADPAACAERAAGTPRSGLDNARGWPMTGALLHGHGHGGSATRLSDAGAGQAVPSAAPGAPAAGSGSRHQRRQDS
jgi:hypothetical protein